LSPEKSVREVGFMEVQVHINGMVEEFVCMISRVPPQPPGRAVVRKGRERNNKFV
jgi:hypothetical protein